jgi:very-short-patch-repair endonuclease
VGTAPGRREAVEKARQGWIRRLIDLSRRNNLLYFRPLKSGTLNLSSAEPDLMASLLSGGGAVAMPKLVPMYSAESLATSIRDIARRAQANAEEKGLQTLFVALGMATWPASDGGRPAEAPVLLFPATLTKQGQSPLLTLSGTPQANLVLLHFLKTEFGVDLQDEDLISRLAPDEAGESPNTAAVFDALRKSAADVPRFEVMPSAFLGNFAFQKLAMVKDLQERVNELTAHDMIAAIAGDNKARDAVSLPEHDLDPKNLDQVPPDSEYIVLDADSSQQCAIASVLAGQNLVIHGPPGTGKSQTIANLVAALAATGRRVLFVAEKRAALEVVVRRLCDVNLGHLAIDLHGADLSPKRVMQQVADALGKVRNAVPVECEKVHRQLVDRRTRLNNHVKRLHEKRQPTGLSVYEMQGNLLRWGSSVHSSTRWQGDELRRITPKTAEEVRDLLVDAAGFESLFLRTDSSPWTGAKLSDGPSVKRAIDLVSGGRLRFPTFVKSLHAVIAQTRLTAPSSIQQARQIINLVTAVQSTLRTYSKSIYSQDLELLLKQLEPARAGRLSSLWAWLTRASFRRCRRSVLQIRTAGAAPVGALLAEVQEVQRQVAQWAAKAENDSTPCEVAGFPGHKSNCDPLLSDADALGAILARRPDQLALDEFEGLLSRLADDQSIPHQIPKLTQVENELDAVGVRKLVAEIRQTTPESAKWPDVFRYAWLASSLDAVSENDPEIRGFKGATHDRYVRDFDQLDEERIVIAAERVRRAHGLRAIEAMNAHPEQERLIKAEAVKSKRHLPLRKVFAQTADVLTAVCPCWMASPLSVSQLLDGGKQYFDFVIFDEASQVLPEDAIPAIMRGKKLIVAGDNKQLPPTTFFAAGDEEDFTEDEEAGASEGFESLLDMMIPFVRSSYLDWHYRSRDEALINFSNHHIYQNRLVTFPGPGGPPVISHELVRQEPGLDGQEESSGAEVRAVVDLAIRHAREHQRETLGIITMGIRHMNRIQAALDRELQKHSKLEDFFDPNAAERFFVKNLERVQGDERDAIIISIGYGKDRAGNLPLRFGPLLSEAGRRRLNVAITRARQRLTVVSSFSHQDLDFTRVRPGSGVELLRNYLQYAASRGRRLGDVQLTTTPMNDFEMEVFDVLTTQGLKLVPQLGASHYRIDMVAEHPSKPGRFVLAIECDGATYHSSYTARDRDRLRQQQLENLGWRFHRIWSTDWFMRKGDEVKRAMKAFASAVKYADELDDGSATNGQRAGEGNDTSLRTNGNNQAAAMKRGSRPKIPVRPSITQYAPYELVQLIEWISSDGKLRTDDEIVTEMVSALCFSRRGARIESAIKRAIEIYRTTLSSA